MAVAPAVALILVLGSFRRFFVFIVMVFRSIIQA